MSNSSKPHEPQEARPPCQSPTPRVHTNSRPSSQWCHPAISSSVVPFSSCPQSFPASESFPMSQLFTSGGQSIGVSASTSALPMNTQDWSPLGWTGWISLQSKGLSRVFSSTTFQKSTYMYIYNRSFCSTRKTNMTLLTNYEKRESVSCSVASDSFVTPWTVAHQAPLSMGFPRQEYWSVLPFPSPGGLPNLGIQVRRPWAVLRHLKLNFSEAKHIILCPLCLFAHF